MNSIKTRLDYSPELIFTVDVSGTTERITEVRLSIIVDSRKIGYVGRYTDGKAIFKLNDLQKYFNLGVFKYDLEVYIENQYFVPLSGQIEFTEPVRVTADKDVTIGAPVTFQAGLIMAKSLEDTKKEDQKKVSVIQDELVKKNDPEPKKKRIKKSVPTKFVIRI